ncbi:hypothetical protein Q0L73_14020, partial [Staphylococcus aureus]|nr:hypothetical protein [Staphylococcus aureus]
MGDNVLPLTACFGLPAAPELDPAECSEVVLTHAVTDGDLVSLAGLDSAPAVGLVSVADLMLGAGLAG